MDKKSLLAFVVIFLVILAMPSYFKLINGPAEQAAPEIQRAAPEATPTKAYTQRPTEPSRQSAPSISVYGEREQRLITIDTDFYSAQLSSIGGGTIKIFKLKNYAMFIDGDTALVQLINNANALPLLVKYISINGDSVGLNQNFIIESISGLSPETNTVHLTKNEKSTITFTLKNAENKNIVTKSLTFYGDQYTIEIQTDLRGLQSDMATKHYDLTWESGLKYTEPVLIDEVRYSKAYAYSGGETDALDVKNNKNDDSRFTGKTEWTAIRTKYFASAFITHGNGIGYRLAATGIPLEGKNYYKKYSMQVSLPTDIVATTTLYLGPLEYSTIKELDVELENIMSLGKLLKPISKAVLWIFIRLRAILPNYGWVLIVFAFLIKIVLYPLTNKSMQSMKEMQNLQPKIEDLRKKYQSDPQKLNTEQMKLYKEHGVNPMGGCLPLLLQMPILIALFTVFRTTIELRHAPFIWWITDLSAPDTVFTLPFAIPIYGQHINVLPIIMALSTILQQKISGSSSSNPQQKMMTYMMPIMFFFMFNQFPSGLNLYYTLFNLLTVAQQKFVPSKTKRKSNRPSTIDTLRQIRSKTKFK
ncbi:membrane protein insertase YidC [bacterium]|nr:membrane protein insertase YidC [bacterium]MBU1066038.1 membrane protein insertase YidC [bacterium]MBU1633090.1 membrane protein insertase YidC [bacterium]MBU1874290.1 membrane protein insertase YidC [bacterium]